MWYFDVFTKIQIHAEVIGYDVFDISEEYAAFTVRIDDYVEFMRLLKILLTQPAQRMWCECGSRIQEMAYRVKMSEYKDEYVHKWSDLFSARRSG
jgi:hypothetical protein